MVHDRKAEISGVSSFESKPQEGLWGTWVQKQCSSGYIQLNGAPILHLPGAACSIPGLAQNAGIQR